MFPKDHWRLLKYSKAKQKLNKKERNQNKKQKTKKQNRNLKNTESFLFFFDITVLANADAPFIIVVCKGSLPKESISLNAREKSENDFERSCIDASGQSLVCF